MLSVLGFVESHTQLMVLRTLTWCISGLSMLGSALIIFFYIRNPKIRSFTVKLLLYLSIADFLAAGSHFLHFASYVADPHNPELRTISPSDGDLPTCQVQAAMQHLFFLSSFFWTLCFAINQYVQVCCRDTAPFKFEPFYHIISWGIPVISTVVLEIIHAFGPTDLWCWISNDYQIARWTAFYGPLVLIILAIAVLSLLARRELRKKELTRERMMLGLGLGKTGNIPARDLHWELLAYLIAFMLIRTPSVVHRIHDLVSINKPSVPIYTLEILHAIGSPLQGFVNCLLFLTNRTVRSYIRQRGLCCSYSPDEDDDAKSKKSKQSSKRDTRAHLTASGAEEQDETSDQQSLLAKPDSIEAPDVDEDREVTVDLSEHETGAGGARYTARLSAAPSSNLEPFPRNIRKNDIVNVFVATWNLGNNAPPSVSDLRAWIPGDQYDVYAIGTQECTYTPAVSSSDSVDTPSDSALVSSASLSSSNSSPPSSSSSLSGSEMPFSPGCETDWFRTVMKVVGDQFEIVGTQSLGAIRIIVLVRKTLMSRVSGVRVAREGTGVANVGPNKGAVGVSFRLGSLSMCFVNAHLAALMGHLADRNKDVVQIVRSLTLGELPWVVQHHALFFFGDLNYRINLSTKEVVNRISKEQWERLAQHDELSQLRANKVLFYTFNEGGLYFPPTYKYGVGVKGDRYNSKKRTPAWCDRVLWKVRPGVFLQQTYYSHIKEIVTSDHKPVSSSFRIGYPRLLRPISAVSPALQTTQNNTDPSDEDTSSVDGDDTDDEKAAARRTADWHYAITFSNVTCVGAQGPRGLPLDAPYITFKAEFLDAPTESDAEYQFTSQIGLRVTGLGTTYPVLSGASSTPSLSSSSLSGLPRTPSVSRTNNRLRERFEWDATGLPSLRVSRHSSPRSLVAPGTRPSSQAKHTSSPSWSKTDLQTSCVVMMLRDDSLKAEDDMVGVCAVELRDAFGSAPALFEIPILLDTQFNGVLFGSVHVKREQKSESNGPDTL